MTTPSKGHYVDSSGSDYFTGWCEIPDCPQYPCLSCVAAQKEVERRNKLRSEIYSIYMRHHLQYPKSVFIDEILAWSGK